MDGANVSKLCGGGPTNKRRSVRGPNLYGPVRQRPTAAVDPPVVLTPYIGVLSAATVCISSNVKRKRSVNTSASDDVSVDKPAKRKRSVSISASPSKQPVAAQNRKRSVSISDSSNVSP